ncbi:hypothetical protein Aperf_G00000014464 [Anoplocephala perfoliata]
MASINLVTDAPGKKGALAVEPGPNPFKPPIILNIHMKYDERKQNLDVLVRNLQNTPLGSKVKVIGKFVERRNYENKKKPGLVGRIAHREKTDAEGYAINSHTTPAKTGPNPHFNTSFPFGNLIRADVQCGKLIFEIFETSLTRSTLLGTVELEGCEIQLDRDTAYSLYVRSPYNSSSVQITSVPSSDVADGKREMGTISRASSSQEFECFQEQGTSRSTSASSSTSSSSQSGNSDEVVRVDPRKITNRGEQTLVPVMVCEPLQQSSVCKRDTEVTRNQCMAVCDQESSIDENAMMLHTNIQYSDRHQRLTVFIRNLGLADGKYPHSIKCVLYTADGRRLERQSSSKPGTNPYFNQEVKFRKLIPADIRGGHLLFSVNERKRYKKKVIGMGIIPGSKINLLRDEAYNTPIVQQYFTKIPKKFVYNRRDMINEPENLVRVIYPESQKHIEIYK